MRVGAMVVVLLLLLMSACRTRQTDIEHWEERAEKHGARSVLNLGHTEAEMDAVTRKQVDILFPILKRHLTGNEKLLLDFGSGSGRFTPALANLIGGQAIGVDPIQKLLDLSPRAENVEYRVLQNGRIPLEDKSVDVVWISLVLGAITQEPDLRLAISEVDRVLKDDGLVFLVENTADKPDLAHFHFRPIDEYRAIFPSIPLTHESDYDDLGERISIFAGRKRT
jgi:ubiquinone/menaquinone biosynthesis C-methylase UbiE